MWEEKRNLEADLRKTNSILVKSDCKNKIAPFTSKLPKIEPPGVKSQKKYLIWTEDEDWRHRASEMTRYVKVFALPLATWVQSLELVDRWNKRTDSTKLPSDLNMQTMAGVLQYHAIIHL